ncbi:Phosphoglucomutase/phosphomannomutase [Trachipleistophora hominis]|uniref:Phosphoglucomutase/phosphomannomutase n=1 Tax=Trachipleistophora hominis TaxID=72359 RepID=L7JW59_TRAHO|nr:Phosphoglucomutase/phosphomannomutase [Trachipleistophora hominis]
MDIKSFLTKNLPPTLKKPPTTLHYGTSGYRDLPSKLPISRTTLCAYMRSSTLAGKYIGILLTASHNDARDNGIKLVDHNGEMFDRTWEGVVDKIVNCEDNAFYSELNKVHRNYGNFRRFGDGPKANIIVGRDTRESGVKLVEEIVALMGHFNCSVVDYGVVSTPQMHYLVAQSNRLNMVMDKERYFDMFIDFIRFADLREKVNVDTSNGVAGYVLSSINERLSAMGYFDQHGDGEDEQVLFVITNKDGEVNDRCGAQYIQYEKQVPYHLENAKGLYASFDGDMDRFIYFTVNGTLTYIDGDRQANILVKYLSEKVSCKIGCVLSDYSNSAAVNEISKYCEAVRARTGIKNFIKKSKEYDIGVYNEPNGHGGIFFSKEEMGDEEINNIIKMYRESIADPLANFLLLEYLRKTRPALFEETYVPFPSRMLQVCVVDPTVVVNSESLDVVEPVALRNVISNVMKNGKGKVFVRPSGTENVIRIFCEAKENVDVMCLTIAQAVYDLCGGVGKHPEISYV